MATKVKTNKATRNLTFTKILAGITQHVTVAIILGGVSRTAAALSAIFQAALQAQADLDAARTAVSAKVQAHKAALKAAMAAEVLLHKWAEATFGPESTTLEDFGFSPATPVTKPVAVRADAAAKSAATRKAKKTAISAVTPGAQPAVPTPPAAPAKA